MKWDGEKLATRGLAVLIAYAAIAGIFRAASKPFWYDELCTVAINAKLQAPGCDLTNSALAERRLGRTPMGDRARFGRKESNWVYNPVCMGEPQKEMPA